MNDAPTCGELIRDRQETTDWSYRGLAERSPAGLGLNKVRWRELRMEMAKTFSGKQLYGVAAGLGPSEQVAGRAALATTGLTLMSVSGAIRTANAVHADPSLTERDRRIITAMLRKMSAVERGDHGHAASMNQADGDPAGEQQDPHTTSAVRDETSESERGTGLPADDPERARMQRLMSAWTGKASAPAGSGSRTSVSAGRDCDQGTEGREQPSADLFYGLAADSRPTEGMAQRGVIDEAGEESRAPDDDVDGGPRS